MVKEHESKRKVLLFFVYFFVSLLKIGGDFEFLGCWFWLFFFVILMDGGSKLS